MVDPQKASRENAFFNQPGENTNIAPVVFKSDPANSSSGGNKATYFQQLGDLGHAIGCANPPTIKTCPLGRRVAVWLWRSVLMRDEAAKLPFAGP